MTSPSTTNREPVPIKIDIGDAAGHLTDGAALSELRDRVAAYVDGMLHDLGIAGTAEVVAGPKAGANPDDPVLRLAIRGAWCRQPLRPRPPLPATAREAARQVQWDLWRNRLLLMTPADSTRIRNRWIDEGVAQLSALDPLMFHELVSSLLARGFDVRRARALPPMLQPSNAGPIWRAIETLLDEPPGATRTRVLIGRRQWDAFDASAVAPGDRRALDEMLHEVAFAVRRETGVLTVPPAAGADARLEDHEICFQVNDLRSPASDALGPGEWLMLTGGDAVASAGIVATTFTDPAGEVFPRVAGDAPLLARCRELGKTEGAGGVIAFGLRERMCAEAANLLTVESVECLLDVLHETDGVLVDAAADRFDHAVLAWILRDLVASGVPVRDLRGILEALMSIEGSRARADGSVTPQAVAYWADWVRCEFRRQISSRHLAGREVMTLWLVAPDLEARIAGLHAEPLTEQERGRLFASLLAAYDQDPESPFVVLTTIEASRPLRALIRQELPTAAVLSFHELGPELYIKPLGRIGEL